MKWNKFPDIKPKDEEEVILKECTDDGFHYFDIYTYKKLLDKFYYSECCYEGYFSQVSEGSTVYWMSIPSCPCGNEK